jgi:acetyl/propionyl-CoA carboxylase alpha subunit
VSERPAASVAVTPLGRGRYLVSEGSRRRVAFGVQGADATWVFLDGLVHVVHLRRARRQRARTDHDGALTAPMPATIVRVEVRPGQRVARGAVLVVLEAMKMELPLRAPRDAVVKAVHGRAGDLVQPGIPLVELE